MFRFCLSSVFLLHVFFAAANNMDCQNLQDVKSTIQFTSPCWVTPSSSIKILCSNKEDSVLKCPPDNSPCFLFNDSSSTATSPSPRLYVSGCTIHGNFLSINTSLNVNVVIERCRFTLSSRNTITAVGVDGNINVSISDTSFYGSDFLHAQGYVFVLSSQLFVRNVSVLDTNYTSGYFLFAQLSHVELHGLSFVNQVIAVTDYSDALVSLTNSTSVITQVNLQSIVGRFFHSTYSNSTLDGIRAVDVAYDEDNSLEISGGIFRVERFSVVTIRNVVAQNIKCNSDGAILHATSGILMHLLLENFLVDTSNSKQSGAVFSFYGGINATVRNVTASNVYASLNGGLFAIDNGAAAIITDVVAVNVSVGRSAGILIVMNNAVANMSNLYAKNVDGRIAGLVGVTNTAVVHIFNMTAIQSIGTLGGVFSLSQKACLYLTLITIESSLAPCGGGVIRIMEDATSFLRDVTVNNVRSEVSKVSGSCFAGGGVIAVENNGRVHAENMYVSNVHSNMEGGTIYLRDNSACTITNLTVS
eukprot:PhF_6_TR7902/c1_g1_i4/m.11718